MSTDQKVVDQARAAAFGNSDASPLRVVAGEQGMWKLVVDVPFELGSIAEAEVDISRRAVLVRATASGQEVRVELHPRDPEIDVDGALVKFSKKKKQLSISWAKKEPTTTAEHPGGCRVAAPEPVAAPAAVATRGEGSSAADRHDQNAAASLIAKAEEAKKEGRDESGELAGDAGAPEAGAEELPCVAAAAAEDDDDDDDLPPMLAKKGERPIAPVPEKPKRPLVADRDELAAATADAKKEALSLAAEGYGSAAPAVVGEQEVQSNPAAELMMQRAMEGKQKKAKEVEAVRKKSVTSFSGGMKKGFLSGGGSLDDDGKKKKKGTAGGGGGYPEKPKADGVTYLAGNSGAGGTKREQLLKDLELPEVQSNMKDHCKQLQSDTSWVTPALMQALVQKPHLAQLMSSPKVQDAMQLMQKDPAEAKRKYDGDPDVALFMKEFSGLMATHFDLLSKEEPKPQQQQQAANAAPAPAMIRPASAKKDAPARSGAPSTTPDILLPKAISDVVGTNDRPSSQPPAPAFVPPADSDDPAMAAAFRDPQVAQALQNPEVMQLIEELKRGVPLEPREIFRRNPRLFQDIQVLLKNGLLNVQS